MSGKGISRSCWNMVSEVPCILRRDCRHRSRRDWDYTHKKNYLLPVSLHSQRRSTLHSSCASPDVSPRIDECEEISGIYSACNISFAMNKYVGVQSNYSQVDNILSITHRRTPPWIYVPHLQMMDAPGGENGRNLELLSQALLAQFDQAILLGCDEKEYASYGALIDRKTDTIRLYGLVSEPTVRPSLRCPTVSQWLIFLHFRKFYRKKEEKTAHTLCE